MLSDRRDLGDSKDQLTQACKEMLRRLSAGEPCRSEDMLAEFPAIASDPRCSLELIHSEYVYREQIGQTPDPAEWYERFPAWKAALEERFHSHTPQEQVGADAVATVPELTTPHEKTDEVPAVPAGRRFGRYTLIRELGRGGMGVVYEAYDNQLERTVALKIVRAVNISRREEVERFHREAKAAAKLDHPNIIAIHDDGEADGDPYYTMTFVNGGPLGKHMARLRSDPRAAVALLEKVARTVHHAHQMGVIHRDLKPANILIDDQNEPRIGDFGLAKIMDDDSELTHTGQILGTPAYMSPEQAQGRAGNAGPRSDVWSLGVILYETLVGRRPFLGRSSEEIAKNVVQADPTPPRTLEPSLDPTLEIIILKCLEKDPATRYPSAAALAEDLHRWNLGEEIKEHWWVRARRAIRRRRTMIAGVVGLLAGIGLATLGFMAITHKPDREPIDLLAHARIRAGVQVVVGEATVTPVGDGGAIGIESKELAMVQLMETPPWPRYRFRAKLQDLGTKRDVGIYVMGQHQSTVKGDEYWFCQFTYIEQEGQRMINGKEVKTAEALLNLRRHVRLNDGRIDDHKATFGTPTDFKGELAALRTLAIEVTPDAVSAYWAGRTDFPYASVLRTPVLTQRTKLLSGLGSFENLNPPAPAMRGTLGLICDGGSCTCEEAILEPLGD